ncbi:C-type lectin domain family 4 member K isoform X3 [Phalacrocorax carbo]|uniref:C-type lectin domain family 4 member K isoform X3 n=1 Tax=Phalacrocorax carbo TaxID=9209 RepID=UPI003119EB0D
MAAARPDLYESLQIRYPPSPTQAPAPRSPPAAPRWVLGTVLAVGTGVILVLGATLAALITLYVQGQADLRAAQAELAALSSLLLPDGARSPSETPAAAQQRKEKLGQWLQGLSLGWRYHQGKIYFFSSDRKPWGRGGGGVPLHARPPHLHHQPRGAGLPGAGGEGRNLLDRAGGHGPRRLLALGGRGCLLPGPEFLGSRTAGQHGLRTVGPGDLCPDPPRGQRPVERP